jgi:(4S)-4-hydroxy-5-phosphonooxypentane-2,3-dione isomerase
MAKQALIVAFDVKPAALPAFLAILREHAVKTLEEEAGCERFDVLTSRDGGPIVHLYEVYRDEAAFELHRESARLVAVRDRYRDLINGRSLTACEILD